LLNPFVLKAFETLSAKKEIVIPGKRSPAPHGVQGEGRACTPKCSVNASEKARVSARRRGNLAFY